MKYPILPGGAPRTKNHGRPLIMGTTPGMDSSARNGSPVTPDDREVEARAVVGLLERDGGRLGCEVDLDVQRGLLGRGERGD